MSGETPEVEPAVMAAMPIEVHRIERESPVPPTGVSLSARCERGEGAKFVRDGLAEVDGKLAVNASGCLKCFGHPIGATGCRMLCEITRQIQGRAEGAQVKGARLGLAHNLGGPGSISSVTILGLPE